jgi:hypothetical protein
MVEVSSHYPQIGVLYSHQVRYASSDLEDGAFALDPVEHTGVVNWDILFGDSLDDLL